MTEKEGTSRIGLIKFYSERGRQWVNWMQFMMVAYLTVVQTDVDIMFMLAILLALMIWTYIDLKFIYPKEANLNYQMNPAWTRMEAKMDRVLKAVEKE